MAVVAALYAAAMVTGSITSGHMQLLLQFHNLLVQLVVALLALAVLLLDRSQALRQALDLLTQVRNQMLDGLVVQRRNLVVTQVSQYLAVHPISTSTNACNSRPQGCPETAFHFSLQFITSRIYWYLYYGDKPPICSELMAITWLLASASICTDSNTGSAWISTPGSSYSIHCIWSWFHFQR